MEKTHWKSLTNSDYLGAYSLMDGVHSTELTVKIISVSKKDVQGEGGKTEECIVAQLEGQKPMILNATNCKTISALYDSPFIDDWVGKFITLYVASVKVKGDMVDALRIRPTIPVITLPELTPGHPSWNLAKEAIKEGQTTVGAIRKKYDISEENEKLLTEK